ncbi:TWiK family of potassium channels protein 7 [Folsomia candida]|uniref:TWiK family of potassium channels protein 7 n=1 Tax=Folsomia candida TaxID=158441 RepID=A0A226DV94_FOLCA|nr:TWiK family of potassium channels protein 7 [Folsomia candida]
MTTRTDHENDPRPDENVDSFQKHFFLPRVEGFFGHLCLFVGLFIYTCVGAWIFQKLEEPHDLERGIVLKQLLLDGKFNLISTVENKLSQGDSLNVTIMEALDKYDKIFVKVGLEGVRHLQPTSPWSSYVNAFFFASTVLTTVGKTQGGRGFCIIFATIGIPLTVSAITNIGKLLASVVSASYKNVFRPHNPASPSKWRLFSGPSAGLFTVVVSLFLYSTIGAYLFTFIENWAFFDSFYFCFITMTTIGFGDIIPAKTSFIVLYAAYFVLGLAMCSMGIELVRNQYAKSWETIEREVSTHLHELSVPLSDTLKKYGDNMEIKKLGDSINVTKNLPLSRKSTASRFKKASPTKSQHADEDLGQADNYESTL